MSTLMLIRKIIFVFFVIIYVAFFCFINICNFLSIEYSQLIFPVTTCIVDNASSKFYSPADPLVDVILEEGFGLLATITVAIGFGLLAGIIAYNYQTIGPAPACISPIITQVPEALQAESSQTINKLIHVIMSPSPVVSEVIQAIPAQSSQTIDKLVRVAMSPCQPLLPVDICLGAKQTQIISPLTKLSQALPSPLVTPLDQKPSELSLINLTHSSEQLRTLKELPLRTTCSKNYFTQMLNTFGQNCLVGNRTFREFLQIIADSVKLSDKLLDLPLDLENGPVIDLLYSHIIEFRNHNFFNQLALHQQCLQLIPQIYTNIDSIAVESISYNVAVSSFFEATNLDAKQYHLSMAIHHAKTLIISYENLYTALAYNK